MQTKVIHICDKLILGALVLLVFLVPLAQTASTYAVNEPIKLMFFRIITVLIAALWLVRIAESGELSLRRTPFDLPLLTFVLVSAIATLFSIDPHLSTWGQLYRYEGLVTIVNYIFIYYVAVHFVRGQSERNLLLGAMLFASGLVAIYAVLQHFGIDIITWDPEMMDVSRSFATFGNPVFLGAYLTLVIPIAIVFAVFFPGQTSSAQPSISDEGQTGRASSAPEEYKNETLNTVKLNVGSQDETLGRRQRELTIVQILLRITLALLIPLLIAALAFSYTRAAWLGFFAALVFIGLFSYSEIWRRKKIAIIIIVLIIAVMGLGFTILKGGAGTNRSLKERIRSIFEISTGSVASRLLLWDTSLRMIKARPLLGFGLDTYALAFQQYQPANWYKVIEEEALPDKAHNEMLQVTISAGLLGLMAYLWLLVTFLAKGFGALRKAYLFHRSLLAGLLAAIIGYLIQIQFNFSIISVAPLFWLLLGLTASAMETEKVEAIKYRFFNGSFPVSLRVVLYMGLIILVVWFSISAIKPFLAEQHVRKAWTHQAFNFWDEAISELEHAVKLNPGEGRYYVRLGEAYLMKYRSTHDSSSREKALATLEIARSISPRNKNIYFYLGGLYVEMGKTSNPRYFDQAASNYKKVLELSPNDVNGHFDLGIAYANRNKYELAIKEWKRAIILDPKFVAAYLVLGRAYELRNEKKAAKKMYQKALAIDAKNVYARKALENLGNR